MLPHELENNELKCKNEMRGQIKNESFGEIMVTGFGVWGGQIEVEKCTQVKCKKDSVHL